MKKRLTVNVDAEVIPAAKRYARARGVSLSSLVERSLRELAAEDGQDGSDADTSGGDGAYEDWASWLDRWLDKVGPPDPDSDPYAEYKARKRNLGNLKQPKPNEGATSWAERWAGVLKGKFEPPTGDDPRYEYLWYKHRLYELDDEGVRTPAEQERDRELFLQRWRRPRKDKPAPTLGESPQHDELVRESES